MSSNNNGDKKDPVQNLETIGDFNAECQKAFGDQNKRVNAKNQLSLLHQGTKMAEEYFQVFDQLV